MPPWLRTLTAYPVDLRSIPSTHIVAQNCLELQSQGIQCLLLTSVYTGHTHDTQTYMQEKTHTHKLIKFERLFKQFLPKIFKRNKNI